MTNAPLPDRIAAAITSYWRAAVSCDQMDKTRAELDAAIAEVVAERDALRSGRDAAHQRTANMLAKLREDLGADLGCGGGFVEILTGIIGLREQRDAATKRADGLAADLAACVRLRDKALADAEAADAAQIAHQKKWESVCAASRENGTCACSYDGIDDVCDFHAPKLAAAKADLAKAKRALEGAGWVDNGGEAWKPPLGPSPSPLLGTIDALRTDLAAAQAKLAKLLKAANYVAHCFAVDMVIEDRRTFFDAEDVEAHIALRDAIAAAEQGGA